MTLSSVLANTASQSRLNAIEQAYRGTPGAGSNFRAEWQGFDSKGNGLARYNGVTYSATTIGNKSIPYDGSVVLRAGKNIKTIHW